MSVELEEFEAGRWRVKRANAHADLRSCLPMPHVISDTMPATEQVDGRFYESKAAFRAVGRSLGLTEVGNEKMKPKTRATATTAVREKRRDAIKTAIERYKAGGKPRKA